jgi:hypothetical protein
MKLDSWIKTLARETRLGAIKALRRKGRSFLEARDAVDRYLGQYERFMRTIASAHGQRDERQFYTAGNMPRFDVPR